MATAEDLIEALGRLGEGLGWSLVAVERGPEGVGLVFQANDSPYGTASSRHRAKTRVAVLSDVMTQQILAAQPPSPQSQRILRAEEGGFAADPDL